MAYSSSFYTSTQVRAASAFSTKEQLSRYPSFSIITVVADQTPTAFTSVDVTASTVVSADRFAQVAHTMVTGLKVRVAANASSTLPTGLAPATDYFVIRTTADTFKLASSLDNAVAGTAIDITVVGTGTMTVTPTALSASFKLQASNDGGSWADIPDTTLAITAGASQFFEKSAAQYEFVRCSLVVTAGQLTVSSIFSSHT